MGGQTSVSRQRGWRGNTDTISLTSVALAVVAVSAYTAWVSPDLGYISSRPLSIMIAVAAGLSVLLFRVAPFIFAGVAIAAFGVDTVVFPLVIAMYALGEKSSHSRWRVATAASLAVLAVLGAGPLAWSTVGRLLGIGAVVAGPLLLGLYISTRRNLIVNLSERAGAAERETLLAAENARLAERTRIAYEMHDALGHRVTLISLQASALEVMPAAANEAVQERVKIIAETSRTALEEVRNLLGILDPSCTRASVEITTELIEQLVRDASRLGITTEYTAFSPKTMPGPVAALVFRIIQEGLTNAAKHAPGSHVQVSLRHDDGLNLTITDTAVNATTTIAIQRISAGLNGGQGLRGLAERVTALGGEFTALPCGAGVFVIHARLPDRASQ